jgi:KUP system potassium uptake protein
LATVVASQAVISGVFSMTQQLIQLRVVPRMRVLHTSDESSGQIYMPAVNWMMLILVVTLVLYFQSSNAMGAAYGIAVTGTMLITDLFAIAAVIHLRHWHWSKALLGALPFLVVDTLFFSANALKFMNGGWFPIGFSVLILLVMSAWIKGLRAIQAHESQHSQLLAEFLDKLKTIQPYRSEGTAVCLTSDERIAPMALVRMGERLHTIPQKVICLNIVIEEVPRVPLSHRASLTDMGQDIYLVILKYGYSDRINLPADLHKLFPQDDTRTDYGYVLNRWAIEVDHAGGWSVWQKRLFAVLLRNAAPNARIFEMPTDRVMEIGARLVL